MSPRRRRQHRLHHWCCRQPRAAPAGAADAGPAAVSRWGRGVHHWARHVGGHGARRCGDRGDLSGDGNYMEFNPDLPHSMEPHPQDFGTGTRWNDSIWWSLKLVGGLRHFLIFHILGIILPTDFHIFQRGWNHQPAPFFWSKPPLLDDLMGVHLIPSATCHVRT